MADVARVPRALEAIDWRETSGVDHPANEEEGWLVMKAASPAVVEDVRKALEDEENVLKAHAYLGTLLDLIQGTEPFVKADRDVHVAHATLQKYLIDGGHVRKVNVQDGERTTQMRTGGTNDQDPLETDSGDDDPNQVKGGTVDTAWVSQRRGVIAMAKSLLTRMFTKAEDMTEAGLIQKALGDPWPVFCASTTDILAADTSPEQKRVDFAKAISELSVAVAKAFPKTDAEDSGPGGDKGADEGQEDAKGNKDGKKPRSSMPFVTKDASTRNTGFDAPDSPPESEDDVCRVCGTVTDGNSAICPTCGTAI